MNALLNAIENETNYSTTENGALTHASSLDSVLDFFYIGPVSIKKPIDAVVSFRKAYAQDRELSLRCLQWVRDIRGGAGARQAFRDCLTWLILNHEKDAIAILDKTAEIGRWDDILVGLNSSASRRVKFHVIEMIRKALMIDGNGLCAKWLPRKGEIAAYIRNGLKLSPVGYRKLLVQLSSTVEQQMCSNEWDKINFSHVPSIASKTYRNAFKKHQADRYSKFVEDAVKGNNGAKINAQAIFPHDVIAQAFNTKRGNIDQTTRDAINAQWNNLPIYIENDSNILVLADVSSSMCFNVQGNTTAMEVSISLALYISQHMRGAFKDSFITFNNTPQLLKITGKDIVDRAHNVLNTPWGGSTNFEAVFDLVLNCAIMHSVPVEEMPEHILVLSDMEFNEASSNPHTNFGMIEKKYKAAGYPMPKLIFWNLNGRSNNIPVTKNQKNVALISGFSPAILDVVFDRDNFDPINIMCKILGKDRYDLDLKE